MKSDKKEIVRLMVYADEITSLFDDRNKLTTSDFQGALDALIKNIIQTELKVRNI